MIANTIHTGDRKMKEKRKSKIPNWVYTALFIGLCLYGAFGPYVAAKFDNTLNYEQEQRGMLKSVDALYGTGLYGARYKQADNIQFADGTILFDVELSLPEGKIGPETVITCGTYTAPAGDLPLLGSGGPALFSSDRGVPLERMICTTPDNIQETYEPGISAMWLLIGGALYWYSKREKKGPKKDDPLSDDDSGIPKFL